MDRKYPGLCFMVLAFGRRWTTLEVVDAWAHRWCVFVSANDTVTGTQGRRRRGKLVTQLYRLSLSGLQYEHCFFSNGYRTFIPVGQVANDYTVADFSTRHRAARWSRRQYSLMIRRGVPPWAPPSWIVNRLYLQLMKSGKLRQLFNVANDTSKRGLTESEAIGRTAVSLQSAV